MKKLYFLLLSILTGAISFAQGPLYIYNNSTHNIQIQVQALGSNGDINTTFSCYYIIIPAGSSAGPTIYTFTNFNILSPASLDSQFTEWTRGIVPLAPALPYPIAYTNLTKADVQNNYAPLPASPIWNLVKFDVFGDSPAQILGSGGVSRASSNYYTTIYPSPFGISPGSSMPEGSTFSAVWLTLGNQSIVTFTGN